MTEKKLLLTGNEAAVLGAIAAGAKIMFGYPITPATEILQGWIGKADKSDELQYLQTEDEIAAGFGVLGAVLAGEIAFTASAGPGHVLLQDPLSMAENLRLPFVGIMMQRGGPSTGTVNFSQQEVNLAAFGGNGDGIRLVYSASSVLEMYTLTQEAFQMAWRYRFPTILLGDGYLGKMKTVVELPADRADVKAEPILKEVSESTNIRNCYSSEADLAEVLQKNLADWNHARKSLVLSESYELDGAETVIVAHGLVASAAKDAVSILRKSGVKIGLFRPITLHPFDTEVLKKAVAKAKKVMIFESSLNQLARIVKYELADQKVNYEEVSKPAEGFTAAEIIKAVKGK
ncbi:MAG: ferredoxin oxidoreductase [Candidatus Berkelbacteria bacterium]|nr:ferredoxin oxidoreductase [Candidatus Berkelbacteria bacterium]